MASSDAKTYTIGLEPGALDVMRVRTADRWAPQLLPHLRKGMRLLDCGCGPGSITLGLANAVAPGEVIGVDLEPAQFEPASRHAADAGIANVRFQRADASALPFPDQSFDAIHAHALIMHVPDPVAVLREMWRVLRSGAVVGLSDGFFLAAEGEAVAWKP